MLHRRIDHEPRWLDFPRLAGAVRDRLGIRPAWVSVLESQQPYKLDAEDLRIGLTPMRGLFRCGDDAEFFRFEKFYRGWAILKVFDIDGERETTYDDFSKAWWVPKGYDVITCFCDHHHQPEGQWEWQWLEEDISVFATVAEAQTKVNEWWAHWKSETAAYHLMGWGGEGPENG